MSFLNSFFVDFFLQAGNPELNFETIFESKEAKLPVKKTLPFNPEARDAYVHTTLHASDKQHLLHGM